MRYERYKLQQFASDYEKGNTSTKDEFLQFMQKEITSILQNYVKRPADELQEKIDEYQEKLLIAVQKGAYDDTNIKKWIANKITPLARSYAADLKKTLQEKKKKTKISEKDISSPTEETQENKKESTMEIDIIRPTPRPYQHQALKKMYSFVENWVAGSLSYDQEIPTAFLLHQTMGTGKTVEIGMFIERFAKEVLPNTFPDEKLRVLILSNKIETIQRQYATLFHGRDNIGSVFSQDFAESFYVKEFHSSATRNTQSAIMSKDKKIDQNNIMIISTFQSSGDKKIHDMVKKYGPFHMIWVDEGHHLPAAEFSKAATQYIVPHYNGLLPLVPITTGTSTPALERFSGKPIFEYTLPMYLASEYSPYVSYNMIMRPNLSSADVAAIQEGIIDMQGQTSKPIQYKKAQSIIKDIDNLFVQFDSMDSLVDDIFMRIDDLKGTIYFCPSIKFADELTEKLNEKSHGKFSARSYHSDDRYSDAFKCFRKGELDQIVTIDMLNESVHPGNVRNIVLLRKTESLIVYLQQLGRGLTGESLNVFDYVSSFRNFLMAQDIDRNIQKYRSTNELKSSSSHKRKRFSIIADQSGKDLNISSNSIGLHILEVMRKVYELKSGVEYVKASKENIIDLRKKGVLEDEDFVHHKYAIKAKNINAQYEKRGFIIPESMNGLIPALGGNSSFDTTHEYVIALLQGVDYVRGRSYVTTEQFLEYTKSKKIPMEILTESKRSDFALQKNATEEFPFLLYSKFRHLCQMMMGIGRKGKYTTEMFHSFVKEGKVKEHTPFATLQEYKDLYKNGMIKDEHLVYTNWKSFAQEFNKQDPKIRKIKLHENRGSVRELTGQNDGKYTQRIIQGETIKRNPTKAELITARNNGDIDISNLDRKKWPSQAEFLNKKYKDGSIYDFTFPLTFDALAKIMEESKYKTRKQLHDNHSYPKGYMQSLFNGRDYKHPLPKATQDSYKKLIQDEMITIDMFGQFTWKRFAQSRNKMYSKKYGFELHESYQSAIANILNLEDKKSSRGRIGYEEELDTFFEENTAIKKMPSNVLTTGFSSAAIIQIQRENMIFDLTKKASEAEKKEDRPACLEAYRALKSLDKGNEHYKERVRYMGKKIKNS